MQGISDASSSQAKELLDFTKRQQLEHVESFAEMKDKIEKAMKLHDEYINVSQLNISLAGELQDYKQQARVLLEEIHKKDDEIGQLKLSLTENNSDVSPVKADISPFLCT